MNDSTKNSAQPVGPHACAGHVWLVGAGPGDAGLMTVAGMRALRQADVVVFDALANPVLLAEAPAGAERIDAGKRAGKHKLSQDETNALLADKALAGKRVVRLKGGDPYVFGRGSEEAMYLHRRGVGVTVVPGVTAGVAGPAYAGVPVTHRGVSTSVTFITGHEDPTKFAAQVDYEALAGLAKRGGTLCFYMGMGRLGAIVERLTGYGVSRATPAAVVQWGTLPKQRHVRATLDTIEQQAKQAALGAPAIIVVGDVAGLNEPALDWFTDRPLFGQTIVVTRTRQQASALGGRLAELGARVIEAPTIRIAPPTDGSALAAAVKRIDAYDWLLLTSENAVGALRSALDATGGDARSLAGVRVAAVGDATARALREQLGVRADFVPGAFGGEAMANELGDAVELSGAKLLYLKADIARRALVDRLTDCGAAVDEVEAYRTLPAAALPDELWAAAEAGEIDWLTFASSSSAENFAALAGERLASIGNAKVASIGPQTSQSIEQRGMTVAVEADRHTVDGLVDALLAAVDAAKTTQPKT